MVLFNLGKPVVDVTLFLRPFGPLAWIGTINWLFFETALYILLHIFFVLNYFQGA